MSTEYRYQEQFAADLAAKWLAGHHSEVRITIRQLKNKAQAAYIAAEVACNLIALTDDDSADQFAQFIHPNNQ
jgi:hypothetical protein